MRIYIVTGTSGSYDDERTWLVKAFRDEAQAGALVKRLNARSEEWCFRRTGDRSSSYYDYPPADWFAEDPNNQADYRGAGYEVVPVELVEP